jgi:hypothetical protein
MALTENERGASAGPTGGSWPAATFRAALHETRAMWSRAGHGCNRVNDWPIPAAEEPEITGVIIGMNAPDAWVAAGPGAILARSPHAARTAVFIRADDHPPLHSAVPTNAAHEDRPPNVTGLTVPDAPVKHRRPIGRGVTAPGRSDPGCRSAGLLTMGIPAELDRQRRPAGRGRPMDHARSAVASPGGCARVQLRHRPAGSRRRRRRLPHRVPPDAAPVTF